MTEFRPCPKPEKKAKNRRLDKNLSDWRRMVLARYRQRCGACGYASRMLSGEKLEAHHLIFKSHCADAYVDDVRNGISLCGPWANDCHAQVHSGRLKVQRRWLPAETVECLAEQGLKWDQEGPYGTLAKYFA